MFPVRRMPCKRMNFDGTVLVFSLLFTFACIGSCSAEENGAFGSTSSVDRGSSNDATSHNSASVVFAAGCFWSVELAFQRLPGVLDTKVGYMGGSAENPSYDNVVRGNTGHAESVLVTFDPRHIKFEELLTFFFAIHDPTTLNRQGPDVGTSYRSAVFLFDESHMTLALDAVKKIPGAVTDVSLASDHNGFWPAEEYHQSYLVRGGQSRSKGTLDDIHCYGLHRRGPVKRLRQKKAIRNLFQKLGAAEKSNEMHGEL